MQTDQDLPEFVDFKTPELLKLITKYESIYHDCDPDRLIFTRLNTNISKIDIDNLLKQENYITTETVVVFYLNYIINYCRIVQKIAPYFIILKAAGENPTMENVTLFEESLSQPTLNQYINKPSSLQLLLLINCKDKWFTVFIDLQNWIIDFKFDKFTNLDQIKSFTIDYITDTLRLEISSFVDYMIDADQPGDCGDLICYTIYKIFVANQPLNNDDVLSRNEIQLSRRRLLWLLLKLQQPRTKEGDDAEFQRRVYRKQLADQKQQEEEDAQLIKEARENIKNRKSVVANFIQSEPEEDKTVKETHIALPGQFNASKRVTDLESFLTRRKITAQYEFNYPQISKTNIKVMKDPRAKVKKINYIYQNNVATLYSNNQNEKIQQIITPASYCIADIFSNVQLPEPQQRRVIDYRIMEENQNYKKQFEKSIAPSDQNSYFQQIGSRIFDHYDYTIGKIYVPPKQQQYQQVSKPKTYDLINREIKKTEEFLMKF